MTLPFCLVYLWEKKVKAKDENKRLLTITMLVSDRKDTIEKCMESLQPLLRAVSSELIVVDTAGDQTCMDVVRRYTDKIIPFSWCDDFSAARNTGLREAAGEWVMFLDDDEWFESTAEIESFFLKGMYKTYNSAAYLTRNYGDREGTRWKDRTAVRLSRIFPETEFKGRIHEYLAPLKRPTYYMKDYVHHYGYVFDTKKEELEHAWRNIRPLLERRREEPEDFQAAAQLLQEYRSAQEIFSAIELAKEMRANPGWSNPSKMGFSSYAMVAEVEMYRDQQRYQEAYDIGKEILAERAILLFVRGCITNMLIGVCNQLERYDEALSCIKDFSALWKKWEKAEEVHYTDLFNISDRYLNEKEEQRFRLIRFHIYVRQKEWHKARESMEIIPWTEAHGLMLETPEDIITAAIHGEPSVSSFEMAWKAMQGTALEHILYEKIDALEGEEKEKLLVYFLQTEPEELKILQYQLQYYMQKQDMEQTGRLLRLMQEKNYSFFLPEEAYWKGLDAMHMSLASCLEQVRIEDYLNCAEALYDRFDTETCEAVNRVLWEKMPQEDIRRRHMRGILLEKKLLESSREGLEKNRLWQQLLEIARLWYGCAEELYRDSVLCGGLQSALPARYQFACLIMKAEETQEDRIAHIRNVAKAAKTYLRMEGICREYLNICREEEQRKDQEFEDLFAEVKKQISVMMFRKQYAEALQAAGQLLEYRPGEKELLAMKKKILSLMEDRNTNAE